MPILLTRSLGVFLVQDFKHKLFQFISPLARPSKSESKPTFQTYRNIWQPHLNPKSKLNLYHMWRSTIFKTQPNQCPLTNPTNQTLPSMCLANPPSLNPKFKFKVLRAILSNTLQIQIKPTSNLIVCSKIGLTCSLSTSLYTLSRSSNLFNPSSSL